MKLVDIGKLIVKMGTRGNIGVKKTTAIKLLIIINLIIALILARLGPPLLFLCCPSKYLSIDKQRKRGRMMFLHILNYPTQDKQSGGRDGVIIFTKGYTHAHRFVLQGTYQRIKTYQ